MLCSLSPSLSIYLSVSRSPLPFTNIGHREWAFRWTLYEFKGGKWSEWKNFTFFYFGNGETKMPSLIYDGRLEWGWQFSMLATLHILALACMNKWCAFLTLLLFVPFDYIVDSWSDEPWKLELFISDVVLFGQVSRLLLWEFENVPCEKWLRMHGNRDVIEY